MDYLSSPIQYIKGVGPKKSESLNKLGIKSIKDLLYYFPRSYEDRRTIKKIADCRNNEKVNLKVFVCEKPIIVKYMRKKNFIKVPVNDDTGFAYLIFYNQDYLLNVFKKGDLLYINGTVKFYGAQIQLHNCTFEKSCSKNKIGLILPKYRLTDKLKNSDIVNIVRNVINNYSDLIIDYLPEEIRSKLKLISLKEAIINIHFPKDKNIFLQARRRLVFDELFILQLGLLVIKARNIQKKGIIFNKSTVVHRVINNLPFKLTNAQKKVLSEIFRDMESVTPMNRLLQGDVGSGKTIIALLSIIKCVESGYQAVMMAPTEILARQHYNSFVEIFSKYGISCELLVGSISKKRKNEIVEIIKNGKCNVVVGTHSLIQDNVKFFNLGLTITDEQHRFGVRQRSSLISKGNNPDVLVMTATPIPRTLSLILYGDLDISIIDEMPPGRKNIKTYVVDKSKKDRVYKFLIEQIKKGRQAYIVCPLVEESEPVDIISATETYYHLKNGILNEFKLGLLHGKMRPNDKDDIMEKFINREIDVLISTTVIEVGVNVPNSNIIIIQNAERFGLAQLHQLRGRVGRGIHQSYCILINEGNNKVANQRMKAIESTNDGFKISEMDLKLRGPGEIIGTKQHGLPDLKIANLLRDISILKEAQYISSFIIKNEYLNNNKEYIHIKEKLIDTFKENIGSTILN